MFILTKIADLVQIAPDKFGKPSRVSIEDSINAKYANRVIQRIGLCVCMYDLLDASDGLIGHGTGVVNVNVEFRMIVFRPFKGETLFGRISSSSIHGISIRTEFFEEIFVPYKELPENTQYDHNEAAWTWIYEGEAMWYDKNEMVRFQVVDEAWQDQTPESTEQEAIEKAKKLSPYSIQGTMLKEGLGVCLWWDG
ncbi:RNA polymerase III subunit Rpc25-domain-containing protein [Durotheca rogersii]|uniref:RNA polymerase III subunit Rpc25-domain-containing protein n=1 Tax=Durotheca rogersii TaxID=419775 RepID=UPI00221FA2EC|nr:RNA polymerase III subunit Rpc25-domain-containing protein [Durotheca rogersii]KAI5862655.1 RNA polymerase III subunit Rpc25-domain-containing protein [Durotheca rogersii]